MFEDLFSNPKFEEETDYLPLISIEEEEEPNIDEDFPKVLPITQLHLIKLSGCFFNRHSLPGDHIRNN